MEEELKLHLNKFATSPFLFVGSGISRRYLGLETWADLLGRITEEIGMANSFRYYLSKANGDLPEVASIIAEEFYDLWWKEERFEESRTEFQDKVKTSQCPFKFEITKYIRNKGLTNIKELEQEINLFRKINIDGIITTNWDLFLESIFPDFSLFIGQESILFQDYISVGDVYKIHGCSSKPNSLVLTTSDYENFNNKNPYLAAKLLTIFIEQPIIFLGYSLNDHNIQEILKSIITCLSRNNIDKLKDRLIFCEWIPEDVEPTMIDSTLLISDTVLPIKLIRLNNFSPLYTVLANNKKRLPIKILRNMKDMVFDFVKSSQSKSKVFVSEDLDEIEDIEKVEFFYGVGVRDKLSEVGYTGIHLRDLLRDIVLTNNWNPEKVAKNVIPNINGTYIPYFKYLQKGNFLGDNGEIPDDDKTLEFSPAFIEKVNSIQKQNFYPAQNYSRKADEINQKYSTLEELIKGEDFAHILYYTPLLETNKINLELLHNFLKENLNNKTLSNTYFRKIICLYDYLANKNGG